MASNNIFSRVGGWLKKRRKKNNDFTLSSTVKSAPSKPTRATSEYRPKATAERRTITSSLPSVSSSAGTQKEKPKHAVGYVSPKKFAVGAKAKQQAKKATSVAEAMKSSEKGLTDREKALKHNVQKAVLTVGNRVGKDYAKDLKSGIYNSKATEKEKQNVAKSIEKDYNKKAKSKKAEAIAGFTKSDANIKAVTKGVTGKDIDVSKVTKSKAYKGGEVAQELASYAIAPNEAAGKAVGKLAVKAIAKNALKKSGQKATKRVVNGAMQKAAADFAKSKGKTFASKRAGEVIANAPLNAKYAADRAKDEKTGKIDKKKFAKDFALNTGFDVGIGSAIGGVQLGKAAKAAKRSAREARIGKMLDSRIKKVEKANKAVKAEKPKVAPTTAKRVKAKVTKKSELNLGQAVKEEYAGIDKRVEKGIISKSEAKKQRKALANVVERRTGGTGVRLNKGYAEVTKKGLKAIDDSDNKLNFDRRIKNVEKIKDKIDKKAVKKEKAKTEFKGLTDEEIRQAEQEAKDARNIAEQDRLDRERAEIDEMANNQKGRYALDPFEAEEIDRAHERHLTDKYGKSVKQDYKDALATANPKAGKDIKPEYRGNQVDEAVEEAQPSRQEIAELFGETRRKQPKGKTVEGKLPERIKDKIDAKAEPKATEKATAEEPQSIVTEEKAAEPTNTSTTEETSLKSPENENPKDDTITAKEDKLMDAVDNLDDTKMMTTHGDNLSDFSKEQRAKLKNKSAKPKATELAEAPEPETPALKDKDFKVSDHVSPAEKASGKAKFNSVITDIRRKLENSMGFSEREAAKWARRNHQPEFAARFTGLVNNMRQSTQRASYSFLNEQIDYNGNRVGESFSGIANDIKGKSPGHYDNVQDYLYLVNHADRVDASGMLPGEKGDKRLFDNLTADEARKMAQELIDKDPELLKDANRIIRYFRNDLKSQVQAGLISEDTFYHYIDTYPNYVPAHRSGFGTAKLGGKPYKPNMEALRAKGSGLDLLPIEDQAKMSAEYTFTRGSTNDVSRAIAEMSGYKPETIRLYDDTDGVDATDIALFFDKKNGKLRFFDNGELRTVEVPEQYLKDIEDAHITATSSEGLNAILSLMGGASRVFKELITSYNPAFVVKNFFRDFPEGALQSQNMGLYLKNLGLGKSFGSIVSNDEWYRAYKRMGGQHGQFINSASDIFKEENWLKKNTLGRIEAWNEFTEQAPRLAEFRAFLEKLGKTPATATPDELRRAAEAAADVTVNFGRSGSIGRIVNKSVIPFFNPAIQGFAKIGRVLTKDKSVSGYVKLLSKMAVLGVAPTMMNELMIGDNPNYQMINERDRAVNYYIPLDADNPLNVLFGSKINGTQNGEVFLKIPKARFLSIIGMGTQSIRGTNDIPFADFVGISVDQIGPVGWENNIFQQFINSRVWDNKSKGKTWYGAEIENTGDQSKLPQDRYDEKTSDIAIELGKITGRSPKKIDYLLDSYTGVIGDIALPARASAAQRGGSGPIGAIRSFAAKNFSTDTVSQNNLTNKVYQRVDELSQKKGSGDTSAETEYGLSYFNKRNAKASEIRDKIRSIQNSSKSKEQKAREVRPLQRELNKLNKTTLDTEKSFVKAAKEYVDRLADAPLADSTKKTYGIENAMIATAKDRGEDPWKLVKEYTKGKYRPKYAKYAKKAGLSPVEYKEFYNLREYDLDGSGGMPSKKEVLSYFATRDDLTTEQKAVLYAGLGGWLAKGPNPYGSVGGSRVGSGGSGGRRRYSRRRYSSRRRGGSSKTTSGKAVGATGTKVKSTVPKTATSKSPSTADVMKASANKTATASALAKILKASTQADYEQAAKQAMSSRKKNKDIYKITAKRV